MNNPAFSEQLGRPRQKDYAEVFSFLGIEGQERLASVVTKVTLEQGAFLFEVGDPATEVFFLGRGRLSVLKKTGFHHRMQVVAILDPGAMVGEAGLLPDHLRGVSVRAIETSQLFCLGRPALEDLEQSDSQLVSRILKHLLLISNLRLAKTTERLAQVL